jgi:hypothetical protein
MSPYLTPVHDAEDGVGAWCYMPKYLSYQSNPVSRLITPTGCTAQIMCLLTSTDGPFYQVLMSATSQLSLP